MMFLAGWLLHSIRLAVALGLALLAMQALAVTREYQGALLQLVRSSEQEIAQRKASAERFYGIAASAAEDPFLAQLRSVEPSNAKPLPPRSIASAVCEHHMTASSTSPDLQEATAPVNPSSSSGESVANSCFGFD